jgi:predicted porin
MGNGCGKNAFSIFNLQGTNMHNKLLALAAVSALATPLLAQAESSVQIYGTINTDLESVKADGATAAGPLAPGQLGAAPNGVNVPERYRVTSNSSNIGFRGNEDLGDGLKAFFQVESAIGFDNQATFGTNTANNTAVGGGLATRNTGVGLSGDWGTAFYGQWDTPYKVLSGAVDPLYFTGIAYTGAIIGTPGFGVGPVTNGNITLNAAGTAYANSINASFERRQGNSIQYWTPNFQGFNARAEYSANEGKSSNSAALTQVDPYIWSLNLVYANGPAYVGYGYESHNDYFGLGAIAPAAQAVPVAAVAGSPSATSRDTGSKLVTRYSFGHTTLGLIFERLTYEEDNSAAAAANFKSYDRNAYALTATQEIGPGTIRAIYGKAQSGNCTLVGGAACLTSGLGAQQVTLGYSYTFSKRTDIYGFYTRVANQSGANYQFANAAGIGASAGAASTGYAAGIRHTF